METKSTNSNSITSFVLSILSLFTFGLILGILGIIFSNKAKREIEISGQEGSGLATAGFVISIIGIIRGVLTLIAIIIAIISFFSVGEFYL